MRVTRENAEPVAHAVSEELRRAAEATAHLGKM